MTSPAGPSILVQDLRVRYRRATRCAVDGMSFAVRPGEIFGFLGPNGAGKSTTQRVLTGLLRGYRGRAEVLGKPLRDWGSEYYEQIGIGFELPAHFSKLTARENLQTMAGLHRGPVDDAGEVLERLDLDDVADQPVATFSKGMQMRLNLARALLHRPRILFLDEPTSGMDPVHAALVREIAQQQAEAGRSVFLTTHDMTTADRLCDRVAFVAGGRIVAADTPRNFRLRYGKPEVVVEYRHDGGTGRHTFGLQDLGNDPEFLELARSGVVESVHTHEASLDKVFAAVTGGSL